MALRLGSGDFVYEEIPDWPQLPDGYTFREVADVAVDADDRVYVFARDDNRIIVLERDGTFVTSWAEGLFTRPHGLNLAPDGTLYGVDDRGHNVRRLTLDGELLTTIGTPGQPAEKYSGQPFDRPTKVALDPASGDSFVADGYGNAKVHKYSADGQHLFSWGDYGTDPGQFNLVHSICTDGNGRVYIADRENHRIQVFDGEGKYLTQWNNMHRPCGLHIRDGLVYVGQLLTHLSVNASYPNLGACVTIHDLSGRRLATLGDAWPGTEPGQFTAPHGITVDSRGDMYVAEVSWSAYGKLLDPPRTVRSFRKLVKVT